MRAKDLKVAIKVAIEVNTPLLIGGAPAIGKTMIAEQVADSICKDKKWIDLEKETGEKPYWMVLHPAVDDPSDYKGLGFPSDDRLSANFLPYGNLKKMIDAKNLLICILDDVGQAPHSVQAPVMQLIRERSVNGLKISAYVRFILCTNRRGDKAGVQSIIEPLKSRCMIVNLEVNDEDWRIWGAGAGMPPELIGFSKLRPQLLHDFKPSADLVNGASPRGWGDVGKLQNSGLVPQHLEYEMFSGCCGEKFSAEYSAFLKSYRAMPNPEEWIKDTNKEFPKDDSILYALASALSYMATKKNVAKIFEVAMRLDHEYSTFMIFSMVQRDPKLSETEGWAKWATKFAPYLI